MSQLQLNKQPVPVRGLPATHLTVDPKSNEKRRFVWGINAALFVLVAVQVTAMVCIILRG